jgi:hypothetical protein
MVCLFSRVSGRHKPFITARTLTWDERFVVMFAVIAGVLDSGLTQEVVLSMINDSQPIDDCLTTIVGFRSSLPSAESVSLGDSNDLYSTDEHENDGKRESSTGRVGRVRPGETCLSQREQCLKFQAP